MTPQDIAAGPEASDVFKRMFVFSATCGLANTLCAMVPTLRARHSGSLDSEAALNGAQM